MPNPPTNLSEAVNRLTAKADARDAAKIGDSVFAHYSKALDCVILNQGEDQIVLKWMDFENLKEKMHVDRKIVKGY